MVVRALCVVRYALDGLCRGVVQCCDNDAAAPLDKFRGVVPLLAVALKIAHCAVEACVDPSVAERGCSAVHGAGLGYATYVKAET